MIRHIKRVGIIGHFAEGLDMADGQIVKTRTVRELLRDVCGNENVHFVDTRGWQKHPFALLRKCSELAKFADVLVMLPAHNGVKIFAPLLVFCEIDMAAKPCTRLSVGGSPSLSLDSLSSLKSSNHSMRYSLSPTELKICSSSKASTTYLSYITTSACLCWSPPSLSGRPVSHGL